MYEHDREINLTGCGAGSCVVAWELVAGRPADAILKDLEAVEMPKLDASKRNDQAYVREYLAKRQETLDKRAALALELYKTAPNHARVPELDGCTVEDEHPPHRPQHRGFLKEIDQVLTQTTDLLKPGSDLYQGPCPSCSTVARGTPDLSAAEEFLKLAPRPRASASFYVPQPTRKKKT